MVDFKRDPDRLTPEMFVLLGNVSGHFKGVVCALASGDDQGEYAKLWREAPQPPAVFENFDTATKTGARRYFLELAKWAAALLEKE
jgi:hypothetical protein